MPTVGIGASAACDGPILVSEDMPGPFDRTPRFVRRYGALAEMITDAAARYAQDVCSRRLLGAQEMYRPKSGEQ